MVMMAGQRVADVIFKYLADLGLKDVFLLPGGGAMHLNDALQRERRITPIVCHHEQACGISAEAYGRVSSLGFGVALVTTGPGATNIITPVAGAWIESLPLLIISGQVKRADAINGRLIRQGGVQEVDIIPLVTSVTKFADKLDDPKAAISVLSHAIKAMLEGRPGPVWIDVPLDVQATPVASKDLLQPISINTAPQRIDDQIFNQINNIIENSKRPLFLIGHGVRISGSVDLFRSIAKKLNIPSVFTWNASDILPWSDPLYIGRPGVVAARAPNFAVQNSDCIISIGSRLDNVVTAYNPLGFARAAKKIIVDVDQNELNRHTMKVDVSLKANAKDFLLQWSKKLPNLKPIQDWRNKCLSWKKKFTPLDGRKFKNQKPINHFQFVDYLSSRINRNNLVITGSSGLAIEVFYTAFRNKVGQRIFLTSGLGSMGYGLSAAIGACIASGKKPTICIESDGSLMLNIQELATLKSLNLPITIIVMNNNGYASIRNTQRNYFESRFIGSSPQSGLMIPDLVKVARSFGIPGEKITNLNQFPKKLFVGSPKLIDIHLAEDEILMPKVSAIPQKDGSMISMPLEDMTPLLPRAILKKEMLIPLLAQSLDIDNGTN